MCSRVPALRFASAGMTTANLFPVKPDALAEKSRKAPFRPLSTIGLAWLIWGFHRA